MNPDVANVQSDLQEYYNPAHTSQNINDCQILYTQPMAMGLSNQLSKTQQNKSFEAFLSPKIMNKSTEKLPTSSIQPTKSNATASNGHIQNVKIFKTSSNVLNNVSPLIKFQNNAKLSNEGVNKTQSNLMLTSRVARTNYHPLKTMDSSEKNVSKKSTQPSKQFSVCGVLSFFSSGRTPSQNAKKPFDYTTVNGQQLNSISMSSPHADGNIKRSIVKGRSPQVAGGAITRFHEQQNVNQTLQSSDMFITKLNNYRTDAPDNSGQQLAQQVSPNLKVSCERPGNQIKNMPPKNKQARRITKQMAIIQNNVKFNQTMMVADQSKKLEEFASKQSNLDHSAIPVHNYQSNQERRQRLSEAQKSIDQSMMTQNTMSFGSFYQKNNEPQFGIFKNSRDQKQTGYIMPKTYEQVQLDQKNSNQQTQEITNPPKLSIPITTKPSSHVVNQNGTQQASHNISNQNIGNTVFIDLSDIQKTKLVEDERKQQNQQAAPQPAGSNPYSNLEDTRMRLSSTLPMAIKTRPMCETPGANQSSSAAFDSDGEDFSVPIETDKHHMKERQKSCEAIKVQHMETTEEQQYEQDRPVATEDKVEEVFINLHSSSMPPYESSGGNLATADMDEQCNHPPARQQATLHQIAANKQAGNPIMSSKSSSTVKMHEWSEWRGTTTGQGGVDTETLEFQKNEEKCKEVVEQEAVRYASALNNAVQQIKFEQSCSNRPSEPEKDCSPDELLNKNIIVNYPHDFKAYQNIQSKPIIITSQPSPGLVDVTPPNAHMNSCSELEQTIFRVSSHCPNTGRAPQQVQISPPSNFEDILSEAKQTEIVQKKSRNPLHQVNHPSSYGATQSTNTLNKQKLKGLNSSPKMQLNKSSSALHSARPGPGEKHAGGVKMCFSGATLTQLQLRKNQDKADSKGRKKYFIHDVGKRVAQNRSRDNNGRKMLSPKSNKSKGKHIKSPKSAPKNTKKSQTTSKKQPMTSRNAQSSEQQYENSPKRLGQTTKKGQQNSDLLEQEQESHVKICKPTWKKRKDLFVEIIPMDTRKSSPDRFNPYNPSQIVDNSPGLILSDGEKLADIQEEHDSQNKSTFNIGVKNSSYRGQDATPDKHSSQRQKSLELQNSVMALNRQDIHSDQYWDQIEIIHKQIQMDKQQSMLIQQQDGTSQGSLAMAGPDQFPSGASALNYIPQSAKLKNSRSFVDKVTRGLGLNLRSNEEFDALEKQSQDLYEKFVENNKRNTGTLQYTTEDDQIGLNDSGTKFNQAGPTSNFQNTQNTQNLRLLNQSFLTNLTNPSKSQGPNSGQATTKYVNNNKIVIEIGSKDGDYIEDDRHVLVASPNDKSPLVNGSAEISQLNSSKDFVLSKSVDKKFKNLTDQRNNSNLAAAVVDQSNSNFKNHIIMQKSGTTQSSQLVWADSKHGSRLRSFQNQSNDTIPFGLAANQSPDASDQKIIVINGAIDSSGHRRTIIAQHLGQSSFEHDADQEGEETDGTNLNSDYN